MLKSKNEKCIWKIFVKYTQIRQSNTNTNTNISSCGFSNTNTNTNTDICVFKYKYKYKYVFDPSPEYNKTQLNYIIKQCILSVVSSEANAHQAGDQEHITTIEDRVVGFLMGSYFITIMNIRIPHAIKIWACLFTLKNILKLRRSSPFSWNIFFNRNGTTDVCDLFQREAPCSLFWQPYHRMAVVLLEF